ncbi:CaiB/BaiF CoA transferase family protein [Nocardia jinanensis]|uniref:Alpha-methylacyl-CoA racemase n=1 Tax=Nocardia jinanensis TaxID=382504 RepID=A0A917RNX9_9NOCA|nr:CaiB/BaiF CoA-transferase family protein [Nocardia jinanensis]GGL16116.1 alpha-methylacyl-CoA racemase [Nocardia jinanensis]
MDRPLAGTAAATEEEVLEPAVSLPISPASAAGPLSGIRVVELLTLGPGAHAGTLLADLGADVVLVARPGWLAQQGNDPDHTRRGRTLVEADLKDPDDREEIMRLIDRADVLLEGFRPGVTERLSMGPEDCAARNPRLVYARMTGWGQTGPRAHRAGHDINYIAVTGHLHAIARYGESPMPPLNLVGDYGGGSMFLVLGIVSALVERHASGRGQTIDAAMVDGASMLGHWMWAMRPRGRWSDIPGTNLLDTGRPFYDVYETSDGEYMAVGALEPQFFSSFIAGLGLEPDQVPGQLDTDRYAEQRAIIARIFKTRTREEWTVIFADTDACVTPVLSYEEAARDPHLRARSTLFELEGVTQPAPAPRFSRTDRRVPAGPPRTVTPIGDIWTPANSA